MPLIATIGSVCAIFIATLFFKNTRPNKFANRLMGVLFLLIAIRLGKVLTQATELPFLQAVHFNLMHAAFLAMGPVLLLYTKAYEHKSQWKPVWLLHCLPALLIGFTASWVRSQISFESWLRAYEVILLFPLPYLLLAGIHIVRSPVTWPLSWPSKALSLVVLIWAMNVLYYWFDFPFYWVTGILVTGTFYLLLMTLKQGPLFVGKKYQNLQLSTEQSQQIFHELDKALKEDKLYMNADLRLDQLSRQLGISLHLLSSSVNSVAGIGFPQYLHDTRIEAAKTLLTRQPDLKIAAVAYEVGYKSLSTFNTAFKDKTKLTPSQYKAKKSDEKGG